MKASTIPHCKTGYFSKLNIDYLNQESSLSRFYQFSPDVAGIEAAINERKNYPINRQVLVNCLKKQYEDLEIHPEVRKNIDALSEEHTFTICSAHQPNLMTGYLYYFYKIIHSIKLARFLAEKHPDSKFVPVFYIGSEDNDIEELGVFNYNQENYVWNTKQTGAVGRMQVDQELKTLIETLIKRLGPPGEHFQTVKEIIQEAYQEGQTITHAIRYIINELLGHYGIVVLDADEHELKKQFLPILKEELLNPKAASIVSSTSEKLNQSYSSQAFIRPINLFYLKDHLRERIEFEDGAWKVVNTSITWDQKGDLLKEIEKYPERFSPNVILRGLYQETILPNIAFVGGGSEVAYWMQLKEAFDHYHVFFPLIILRQSVLVMTKSDVRLQQELNISDEELFLEIMDLEKKLILSKSQNVLDVKNEEKQFDDILNQLKIKAGNIDQTLIPSTEAVKMKIRYQLKVLEKKMLKAEKKNYSVYLSRVNKLKDSIFPNASLQERYETFLPFFIKYGDRFFDILLEETLPFGNEMLILKEK